MQTEDVLALTRATVVRGGTRVLHDVSLTIHAGEHTAILGPNGAGKSSLIRLLTLEDYPLAADDGRPPLQWFGRSRWNLSTLRMRLGIVSGELDTTFAIATRAGRVAGLEAVVSGFFASQGVFAHHQVSDQMRRDAQAALARVEAAHLASKPLTEMSAGERRRVLIARALVTRPSALLLDEPTAGLDLAARHRFMEAVRVLARDGTTILLVTHHVEEIIPEMRRVIVLVGGRVAHDGEPEAVLTAPVLSTVYDAPIQVGRAGAYYHVRVDSGAT